MAFWHLLLLVGLLGAGLVWTLAYLLRHWARENGEKVAARKARFRQTLASAARRLRPPQRKRNADGGVRSPPGRGRASPSDDSRGARPTLRETPLPASASAPRFGTARHDRPAQAKVKVDEAPSQALPVPEREPEVGLRALEAVRSDLRETSDPSLGNLTALFDRLEHGDLSIEEFLKAAALEREEAERQIRCLEVLYESRSELEQDASYQQARDNCMAAIKCQEWALEFRETLRHAHL
ncbi:hypothetical protein [Novosphingobium aquimarinum]|uniref:hypothetical protein n=1 Tax=Novosphingobium aquimarinum TaxID=2682494 RepID=UPI0012EBD510|nr:hypothetical protein [Novosphingobium aquimarinum]